MSSLHTPKHGRTFYNIFWAVGGALARYVLAALSTLALTKLLAPQDFGLVAITAIVQLLIAHVLTVGFHDALIQRPHLDPDILDTAFWSVLGASGSVALLSILLAPHMATAFGQPMLTPLLIGAAGAAWLRALSTVPRALLARRMDFRTLTLARLSGNALGSAAAVVLAMSGAGAWSLLAQVALAHALSALIVTRATHWRPRFRLSLAALRPLWQFAPSVALFTALSYVITRTDDLLIGYRLGAKPLGYYALAYALIAWVVQDVLGGAAVVLYPLFARLQADRARLRQTYLLSLSLAAGFAYPTLVLLIVIMPVGVRVILGIRWLPLVLPAQILALAGLREAGGMFNGGVYRALGLPHLHALLGVTSAPCYVTAFWVGSGYGIAGVAFFFWLTGLMWQPAAWWLLWRASGITTWAWWQSVRPALMAAIWVGIVAAFVLHSTRGLTDEVRLALALVGALATVMWRGRALMGSVREILRVDASLAR